MSYLIAVFLLAILASLAAAGFFLLRKDQNSPATPTQRKPMAWALTVRVLLSVVLFIGLLMAWKMGWIAPHALPLQSQ